MYSRRSIRSNALENNRGHVVPLEAVNSSQPRPIPAPKTLLSVLVLFSALSLLMAPLTARAQVTDGSITGVITDASGATLSKVKVSIRNVDTGVTRAVVTGSDGGYRVTALPPGDYLLTAQHEGFSAVEVKGITLTVGLEFRRDIVLTLGKVEEVVTVTADPLITEPTSSQSGTTLISEAQIDTLPIAGRQTTQLALLTPGTNSDGTRSVRPDTLVGAGDINTASTNYLVDGLMNMISGNGDPKDNVPEATVQEFKVIISQTPAEYGGRSGGVVTVATKSGTNLLHGEAFEYYRSHYINRVDYYTQLEHDENPTANPIQPFLRNQYGGAVGGPILKDRLHYFGSYEHLDDREYFTVAPGVGATGAQNAAVAAAYAPLEGTFRGGGSVLSTYLVRADWHINDKHSLFLKFFLQNPDTFYNNQTDCTAGGSYAQFSCGDEGFQGWTWAAGHTWIVSPRIVNQFSAQVSQSYQTNVMSKYDAIPAAILSNLQTLGTSIPLANTLGTVILQFPSLNWGWSATHAQFHSFYQEALDGLTINHGKHSFKIGGDALNQPRKTQAVATPLGTYTFATDFVPTAANPVFNPLSPNFNWASLAPASGGNTTVKKFTATDPEIPFINNNLTLAGYAQDEWKPRKDLTLNFGLRYDVQFGVWLNDLNASLFPAPGLPPTVQFGGHGDYHNFGPRLGFAWNLFGEGRTVVRGGYGIVYGLNLDNIYEGEVTTLRQTSITINSSKTAPIAFMNPLNGKSFTSYASTQPPNISTNANNIGNPPTYTSSLGVSQQLKSDLALNLDGIYSYYDQLPINENINSVPNPATNTVRPLPAWGNITQVTPIGTYGYRALYVRLDKRYSHHYQYVLSYTLAKQRGVSSITNYYAPWLDDGNSSVDRRNMLVASGSYRLRYGFTLGGIYTLRSALPYSVVAGSATSANGTYLNREGNSSYYIPATNGVAGVPKNLHHVSDLLPGVNAWRASFGDAAIPASQVQSTKYNDLDTRLSKEFSFGERYKVQAIAHIFNVFGTDNFGGPGVTQTSNALSGTFGEIPVAMPRQQGELALRLVF
jgi:hypothetical protein